VPPSRLPPPASRLPGLCAITEETRAEPIQPTALGGVTQPRLLEAEHCLEHNLYYGPSNTKVHQTVQRVDNRHSIENARIIVPHKQQYWVASGDALPCAS
jgi:hypothetical protein